MSLRFPKELKGLEQRLRQHAAAAGVPVSAVVFRAIEQHLDASERQEISRAERTATPGELADESARMQRARAAVPPRLPGR